MQEQLEIIGGLIDKINSLKVQLEYELKSYEGCENSDYDICDAVQSYIDYIDIAEDEIMQYEIKLPNCGIF